MTARSPAGCRWSASSNASLSTSFRSAPTVVPRFNGFTSAQFTGAPKPGHSSGELLRQVDDLVNTQFASAGLGVETARSLAAHGAQVVGAARDLNKAKAATEQVRNDAAANGGSFELVELDLANLKSVRACADRLLAKGEPLDVVIANAGVMATPFGHTADGFETQFGTNHLGHFVLVNRMASLIRDGGRGEQQVANMVRPQQQRSPRLVRGQGLRARQSTRDQA